MSFVVWVRHLTLISWIFKLSRQKTAANAYVCHEHLLAFSLLITASRDAVMAGCHGLFSTCHFIWRGSAAVCLLKQSGYCIWIKMLRCFPASSAVTQTSAAQIRDEILIISSDDCTKTVYMYRNISKGEGCCVLSLLYAFHTVTERHIMSPNTHRRERVICVWLRGCMCTCTKTNINLSCNDTLSSCGRFFSLPPFFIWAQLQFNHVFKQQEISCFVWINCFVWQAWFSGR